MIRLEQSLAVNAPVDRCFDLARSIELHLHGAKHSGERAVGGVITGLIGPGQSVRWRGTHFGVRQHLTSRMTGYDRPGYFQDTMVAGAFQSMRHDHFFTETTPGTTEMRDVLIFAAPLPLLGWLAERLFLRSHMARFLAARNAVLKQVAESDDWARYLPPGNASTPLPSPPAATL